MAWVGCSDFCRPKWLALSDLRAAAGSDDLPSLPGTRCVVAP
jgi:hypothetical protein